jgi:formiminotetrahydrofolate cyclodeaminase
MSKFLDQPLSGFLDALASPEPTPGGGTAAAIAGAMGVSLLMMVGGLSKSREGAEADRVALAEARAALASLRDRLAGLGDTDADAFDQVMAAYRLPKATDQEKSARTDAVQQALKAATIAPLDTLRAASEALRLGRVVAQHGNRSATSDVGVGIGLLEAAAKGAAANVRTNLDSLRDEVFKASAATDVDAIDKQIREDIDAANAALSS